MLTMLVYFCSREVMSVAFSPDGMLVASGSMDRTVMVFNAETGERLYHLKGHRYIVI